MHLRQTNTTVNINMFKNKKHNGTFEKFNEGQCGSGAVRKQWEGRIRGSGVARGLI